MVLTQTAGAEVVYTPADLTLTNGTIYIDLNHDHTRDFIITNFESASFYWWGGELSVRGVEKSTPAVLALKNHRAFAASEGVPIGPESPQPFEPVGPTNWLRMAWGFVSYNYGAHFGGPWANVANKFLGFRFSVNGEVHYGWARLSVDVRRSDFPTIRAHLSGYAYETEVDKTILAGDRGSDPSEGGAPEGASVDTGRFQLPASLGLLSLGSLGVQTWRHQQDVKSLPASHQEH